MYFNAYYKLYRFLFLVCTNEKGKQMLNLD